MLVRTFRFAIAVVAVVYVSLIAYAIAQQVSPDQPSPQAQLQALSGQLLDEMGQVIKWRGKYMDDEAEIAKLQAENDKLKKAVDPPKR